MSPALRLWDRPYLLLTLTSLFWSANAVIGRAVAHQIPPAALSQIRWTLALAFVMPFALRSLREELPLIRRHLGILLLLSLTGITAFNTMLYWALHYTTAINSTIMQSFGPLMIGVWSWLFYRDPLTGRQFAGILVSLAGVLTVVTAGDIAHLAELTFNIGDIVIVGAIAVYGIYATLLRRRPGMSPLAFLAITITLGVLMLLPLTLLEFAAGMRIAHVGAGGLGAILYVSIFPSILAYLFYNRGVQLVGANRSGPFLHLIPLFGVLLAVIFLDERLGLHHLIGALLIIGGVLTASRSRPSPA